MIIINFFALSGWAEMQCSCNCLFAICFIAVVNRVALWTTNDLNFILDQGDQIYKELNIPGMLSIQELPTTINSGQNLPYSNYASQYTK